MKYSAALVALASSASAHMLLNTPTPFPTNGNSPVNDDASDFPCRVPSSAAYSQTPPTKVKAGEKMKVTFKGSAVHGGGSCQFSLSTDKAPTKQSQWKVIHSVIGGCLTDGEGNLPANPDGSGAKPVEVTIPSNLPNGQYTFSWSWLNRIGNREFYHNCAPIEVTGGSGKDVKAALGGLPDMFVINIPKSKCKTAEGINFQFPNPGKSVSGSKANTGSTTVGSKADCDAMAKMGAGNGKLGSPSAGGGSSSPKPEKPSGGNTTPKPEKPSGGNTTPKPEKPSGGAGGACTEGAIVCIGSNQFGICANGVATPQPLAAGTKCSNGAITRRSVRRSPRVIASDLE